jgi:hypothetical protein
MELDLNYELVRSAHSAHKLKFQQHPQISEIFTHESLVGLRLMRKFAIILVLKVSQDCIGIGVKHSDISGCAILSRKEFQQPGQL